jgi:hypothetical protein
MILENPRKGVSMKSKIGMLLAGFSGGAAAVLLTMLTTGAANPDTQVSLAVSGNFAYVTSPQNACYVYQIGEGTWSLMGTVDLNQAGSPAIAFSR